MREVVGKVPVPPLDTLLETGRARGAIQHPGIVIGFENETVSMLDFFADELGCVAEVCHPRKRVGGCIRSGAGHGKGVAHRVCRVVRNGKRANCDAEKLERAAGLEDFPTRSDFLAAGLDSAGGALVGEKDGPFQFGQHRHALAVVAVLVRDEDSVEVFDVFSDSGEPSLDLAGGESGIYEDAGLGRDEQAAVAGTAAAEDVEAKIHRGGRQANVLIFSTADSPVTKTPELTLPPKAAR